MVDAMATAVGDYAGQLDVLVLTGEGQFSVGADLRLVYETPKEMRPAIIDNIAAASNRFIRAIRGLDAPVVAAVYDVAAGGGLGFALACDIIVLHAEAALDTAYARIGLTPDNASPYFLTQAVGPYRARELFFDPKSLSAEEAKTLGLANKIIDGTLEEFEKQVDEYVSRFTKFPSNVHSQTKTLVDTALESNLDNHLEQERVTIKKTSDSEIFEEGLSAFFEGRDPAWDSSN